MGEPAMDFCRSFHELTFDSYAKTQVFKTLIRACTEDMEPYCDTDEDGHDVWRINCPLFDMIFGDEEDDDD